MHDKTILNRKLSLFCLDDQNERNFLVVIKQEVTEEGMKLLPVLSIEQKDAIRFETVSKANKYFSFLTENFNENFFYCILPEEKSDEENISEEEKSS